MTPLERYNAGNHEPVWAGLVALGHEARHTSRFPQARAVARETMRRVRHNVEVVFDRLNRFGYAFANPEAAFVPPPPDTPERLALIEQILGPLPLSLRAFHEVVGSVDFTQSTAQLVRYDRPERPQATDIELLGEEDPLAVASLHELEAEAESAEGDLSFCFAADEFHKAGYSGGEGYHVRLPDSRADFEIIGMYGIDERFVEYLRATFAHGGFRGRAQLLEGDESRCRKAAPNLAVARRLAEGLLSF